MKNITRSILLLALLAGLFAPSAVTPAQRVSAAAPAVQPPTMLAQDVTAYDLIIAMNQLRASYGLAALIEDPIINAVAQSTAEIMAANQMSWHIGDVSGRLQSAGYGGGGKVWGTENFAVGNHSIDEIMVVWSDESHMIPAVNAAYCNVGAGVARSSNGMNYYVLQAAYSSTKSCGEYTSTGGATVVPGGGATGGVTGVSQIIVPVALATPDADGKIFHEVKPGQSFWSIAIAYQITIKDIETWNNITQAAGLQIGQKLFIPGKNTAGYATPTPAGMILVSQPDKDGKVVHTVAVYQTLSTIADAYKTSVDTILALNGWQTDWPLQIGQQLVIKGSNATPSPTPRPLTPIEKLTPAADGKYYHTVQNGETVSWIANLYSVNMADLLAWNGLNNSSILHPDDKLVLEVTPPATATFTPGPPTATATITQTPAPTLTAAPAATTPPQPSPTPTPTLSEQRTRVVLPLLIALGAAGLFLVVFFSRRK